MNAIVKVMTMIIAVTVLAAAGFYLLMQFGSDVDWYPVLLALIFCTSVYGFGRVLLVLWLDHQNLKSWPAIWTLLLSIGALAYGVQVFYVDAYFDNDNIVLGASLLILPTLTAGLIYLIKCELSELTPTSTSETDQTDRVVAAAG